MPMVVALVGGDTPASAVGTLLAGVIVCCWLAAGAAWMAAVARRSSARVSRMTAPRPRRRPRRSGHHSGSGRVVLLLLGLSGVAVPLLLEGWSGWPWSVGNVAVVGLGVAAARLAARGALLTQRLVMFAVLACLAGAGFLLAVAWRRLILLGGAGTVLALCMAALAAVTLIGMFAASVTEAVAGTLAWCRRGSARRWLLVIGICAVTLTLPAIAGLPWWLGPAGVMLLAASVGMSRIGEAEGGEGHAVALLSGIPAAVYLALVIVAGVLSWQRLF